MMWSGRISSLVRSTLSLTSVNVSRRFWRASSRSVWIAEICSWVVMVSIAMAPGASCRAVGSLVVLFAGDQVHDEIGSHAAQCDSSHYAQQCEPDAAVGTAANDESYATGNSQRG